jgi:hypothetical protein
VVYAKDSNHILMGIPANIGVKFNGWYGGDGAYSIQLWIINAYCGCLTRHLGMKRNGCGLRVCLLELFSLAAIGDSGSVL